jgi:hypothetical protein
MTMEAMNCDAFSEQLMAYLEHESDEATRAALERHSVSCVDCGAVLADLRKLRIDAANLPALAPSRDLWSGIAVRIEAPVVSIASGRTEDAAVPVAHRRWTRYALMAASLVAAAGVGYLAAGIGRSSESVVIAQTAPLDTAALSAGSEVTTPDSADVAQPRGTSQVAAQTTAPTPAATVSNPAATVSNAATTAAARPLIAERAVATLTADYDREIARLKALLDQRRNQLDPVTVAIIEKNMQVIDTAIAESKQAIARDPSSRFLLESLNQSLRTKVELMRTAALLPSRT